MTWTLLLAASLAQFTVTPAPANAGRGATVIEAVFRDMMRDVPGLSGPYTTPFCLQGPGKSDPPRTAMKRLRASDPRVRPASACRIESDAEMELMKRVVERATGTPAIILNIDSITCFDDRHCSVVCGYFAMSLSASSNTFEVEQINREWVVKSRRMIWIS